MEGRIKACTQSASQESVSVRQDLSDPVRVPPEWEWNTPAGHLSSEAWNNAQT